MTLETNVALFIAEQSKVWDTLFPQVEFAYNSTVNGSIGNTPFSVVHTKELSHIIDLVVMPHLQNAKVDALVTNYTKIVDDV